MNDNDWETEEELQIIHPVKRRTRQQLEVWVLNLVIDRSFQFIVFFFKTFEKLLKCIRTPNLGEPFFSRVGRHFDYDVEPVKTETDFARNKFSCKSAK